MDACTHTCTFDSRWKTQETCREKKFGRGFRYSRAQARRGYRSRKFKVRGFRRTGFRASGIVTLSHYLWLQPYITNISQLYWFITTTEVQNAALLSACAERGIVSSLFDQYPLLPSHFHVIKKAMTTDRELSIIFYRGSCLDVVTLFVTFLLVHSLFFLQKRQL
jgi:hypothetical protein